MTQNERREYLIEYLLTECGEQPRRMPSGEADQRRLLRALFNVRPPEPVSPDFLRVQDGYLRGVAVERGVVDVEGFVFRGGIALWRGNIVRLRADAIVNACNCALLGCFQPLHSCIDNEIHTYAGVQVRLDCNEIMQGKLEENGRVRVTSAYNLPSKYIFHTVGPRVQGSVTPRDRADLKSCYDSCLAKAEEMQLSSLVFCCLSTGVFAFPREEACRIAVSAVRDFLARTESKLKVVFNVFSEEDEKLYERELHAAN